MNFLRRKQQDTIVGNSRLPQSVRMAFVTALTIAAMMIMVRPALAQTCSDAIVSTQPELDTAITNYNTSCGNGDSMTIDLAGNTITYATGLTSLNNATTAKLLITGGTLDANSNGHVLLVVDGDVTFDTMLLTGGTGPNGGALQLGQDTNGTLINTTVTGNTSATAAAILNNGGTLTLTNATVSTNTITADTILGSVWNRINGSTPILNLNNSIIANTFDSGGSAIPDCRNNSGTVNFSPGQSNLIEQDQAGGVACDLAGSNTLSGDPELDSLQDNGGQSHTLALLAGSQAIGNGNNAICAASPVNGLDQRGVSRPQGSACDIGAFEFDAFGSLTIIKEAAVEDGTDFDFTSDIPGGSSFTLDDEDSQTDAISQSITFADIPVGSYAITETVPAGWSVRFATCSGGNDSGSLTDDTLTVALGAGEDITCIFNNSINTNIIINKDVTGDGADEGLEFEFFFNSSIGGYFGTFFLSETESNTPSRTDGVFEDLPTPLLFTVEEENLPANWALQDIECTSSNGNTNITKLLDQDKVEFRISARGDDVECTFINARTGSLTIVKEASPEDGTDFSFSSDIPGGSSFTLDDEASQTDSISQSITVPDIAVGSYAITETLPTSWQLDSATCTGGVDGGSLSDETLTVALGVGEDVTCTFNNSLQPGTIIIEKVTLPAGGTSYGYTQTIRSPFSFLIDGGETETFNNVLPGSYQVVEQDHFPDVLVDLSCDDEDSAVPSVTDIDNARVDINLEAGETVHCIFTNSQLGTLTIIKNVVNDNGGTLSSSDFTINVSGNNPSQTSFAGSDTGMVVTLEPGAYSVTEDAVASYSGSFSADCSGAIAAGESKTCTVTNDDIASTITVNKVVVPASDTGVFSLTIDSVTYGAGGDGATTGAIPVISGTHTIAELGANGTDLAGYNTQIDGDCAADGTVTVGLAEAVTCIITNSLSAAPGSGLIYLPLIFNASTAGPDLVVDNMTATTNAVTVTLRNAGNTAVVDAFWVDVYFNPSKLPGLNEPWDTIAGQGVTWGLAGSNLPLNPGDTRVLTLVNAVPGVGLTSPPPYPAGATVYALVDAIDFTTSYGAVQESDETNNLAQSTVTVATSSGAFAQPTTTGQSPALDGLPPRR